MDSVLGQNVGNTLEIAEALECLQGRGPQPVVDVVCIAGTSSSSSSSSHHHHINIVIIMQMTIEIHFYLRQGNCVILGVYFSVYLFVC